MPCGYYSSGKVTRHLEYSRIRILHCAPCRVLLVTRHRFWTSFEIFLSKYCRNLSCACRYLAISMGLPGTTFFAFIVMAGRPVLLATVPYCNRTESFSGTQRKKLPGLSSFLKRILQFHCSTIQLVAIKLFVTFLLLLCDCASLWEVVYVRPPVRL